MQAVAQAVSLPLSQTQYPDIRPILDDAMKADTDKLITWMVVRDQTQQVVSATDRYVEFRLYKLKPAQVKTVQKFAVEAFRALELGGMARVDFFLEKKAGKIYLNEVNTIPGFTSISMYPKMWEASGIPFRELIDKLIELALEMHREKARTKYAIELPEGAAGALEA